MSIGKVCFSHGQESGPWGTKIRHLANLATTRDWAVESLDYQGMADPLARAAKLREYCQQLDAPPVLVGSSMGGFVALHVAAQMPVRALFLLAPALYLPGYEEHLPATPPTCPVFIVHGWRDDVVPCAGSQRYAQANRSRLLLVDGDHRLTAQIDVVGGAFEQFLGELADAAESEA
ncbi:MAG: alpha/beta hydrolase [Gammaproteobacteria bacterium]